MTERRFNNELRALVDRECAGILPHIADRIAAVARRAYWLGAADANNLHKPVQVCDNTKVFMSETHRSDVEKFTNEGHKEMLK